MKPRFTRKMPLPPAPANAADVAAPAGGPLAFARVIAHLIRDTFRQSLHGHAFWVMFAVGCLCILLCLSLRVDQTAPLVNPDDIAINPDRGEVSFGFGAFRVPLFRDRSQAVHFLHALIGKWVAGAAGILLALVATAGFVPGFVAPATATVLLAKPVPRWLLLFGKLLGVLSFAACQAVLLIGGTWLAIGLRTGEWAPAYLLAIPLFVVHFAVVFGFSMLLGVWGRSTVLCVFGSIVFWLICYGVNYGRHFATALPYLQADPAALSLTFQWLAEIGYWVLPKPADVTILLDHALGAGRHFVAPREFRMVVAAGEFHPAWSLLSSAAFGVVLFLVSARQLAKTDY